MSPIWWFALPYPSLLTCKAKPGTIWGQDNPGRKRGMVDEKGCFFSPSRVSQGGSGMAESPARHSDWQVFSEQTKDGCTTLPNHLLSFVGSLQVFSAVWLRAPQLCWEVHRHGDDESHPGYTFEEIPCEDIAKTMRWKHAQKKWLVLAPQWGQTPCGNNFHSKEFRQVDQAVNSVASVSSGAYCVNLTMNLWRPEAF